MSRPSTPSGASVAGSVALRMPSGDPGLLRARASGLRGIEAQARQTPLLRGAMAQRLPQVWTGAAADAAVAESALLVSRAARVLDALPAASTALIRYAATLEQVRTGVARLQRQWDEEATAHTQAVATTQSQADFAAAAAHTLALLTDDHDAAKSRLSRQHAALLAELGSAAQAAARVVEAASEHTFPSRSTPSGPAVREHLFAGMAFAAGAAGAARSRQVAVGDAAALKAVLARNSGTAGSDGSSAPGLTPLLASMLGRADDPVYAQVVAEQLGVNGIQGLLAELASSDSTVSGDDLRGVTGLLGRLLMTATNPDTADLDPRTERLVDSNSALLRDTVVASLTGEVADSSGGDRYAGYWLMGQLVTGARRSGWTDTIAPGFLARLVTAAARAEVAETRDDDMWRKHGTTISPHGSDQFASFFDDANRSGDALHVLLSQVGDDPVDQLDLLSGTFDGGILTDSRGGPLSVAAYLSRRFLTYNANGPATRNDLHLATTEDLARLLQESSAGGSELAATLRGKVMAEVGRVSDYAQQGYSTAHQYATNTAAIEDQTVDWLLAMPTNVTRALDTPGLGVDSAEYASPVGGDFQPVLSVGELSNLVGAFTLSTNFSAGAKDPAANYQRLINGSLDAARAEAAGGNVVDDDVRRMAFFDASASWALIGLARKQDAFNASMWNNLAEATNFVLALRKGTKELRNHVKTLIIDRTTLNKSEKLGIAVVRSDVELKQSLANEQRTAALTNVLRTVRATAPKSPGKMQVVMKNGTNRLTPLPTSDDVKLARLAEIDAAIRAVQGRSDSTPLNLTPPQPALGHGVQFVFDPLSGGSIDRSDVGHLRQHEIDTAERLMRAGRHISLIPATGRGRTPDILMEGKVWDLKSPTGNSKDTISGIIRDGRGQSPRMIIDLERTPMTIEEVLSQVDYCLARYKGIDHIWVVSHDGHIIERTPSHVVDD